MATLYRKYRPTSFADVAGQEHVTKTLKRAVASGKLTHAYLFHGPRGTGKTTTARILAKSVNCSDPRNGEPCNVCDSCSAMTADRQIDIIEIDAASNRGIDDIRALRQHVMSAPSIGSYKVYIIDEVHMLTHEAATALLKTLEEPAGHVMFVLATTELHKVLPTILSRCQVYRFRRATTQEITDRLALLLEKEEREADVDVLEFIADRADGSFRDAESLLGQLLTMQEGTLKADALFEFLGLPPVDTITAFIDALVRGESAPALAAVDAAFAAGSDPEQFLREAIRLARDAAVSQVKQDGTTGAYAPVMRALLQALADLAYVPQPLLAIHLAVLTVCTTKGEAPQPSRRPEKKAQHVVKSDAQKPKKSPSVHKNPKRESSVTLKQVREVWPDVIEKVKQGNPVASTFLRAVEVADVAGDTVTVSAAYALHRNFFENDRNRTLVNEALHELLGVEGLRVICVLDKKESPEKKPSLQEKRQKQEEDFYKTVQQVFGE